MHLLTFATATLLTLSFVSAIPGEFTRRSQTITAHEYRPILGSGELYVKRQENDDDTTTNDDTTTTTDDTATSDDTTTTDDASSTDSDGDAGEGSSEENVEVDDGPKNYLGEDKKTNIWWF